MGTALLVCHVHWEDRGQLEHLLEIRGNYKVKKNSLRVIFCWEES